MCCIIVRHYEARHPCEKGREIVLLSCGHMVERHSKFCNKCGKRIIFQEKRNNMLICDWETKGNVVRLYLCAAEDYDDIWGDDWNDVPYEHNAGKVYDEYITHIADLYFSWNVDILEAENDWEYQGNSPYSKEMFKDRLAPIFIAYWLDKDEWSWDKCYSRFQGADNSNKILKFYMGDDFYTIIASFNQKVLPHWDIEKYYE